MSKSSRRRISFDYDGVLVQHAPTPPVANPNEAVPGALQCVRDMIARGYEVVVCSARAGNEGGKEAIEASLARLGFPPMVVSNVKLPAALYIDDRGFRFTGDFAAVEAHLAQNPQGGRWEESVAIAQ